MSHQAEAKSPPGKRSRAWNGQSRGGTFGIWFFITVVRLLGPRVAYTVLVPVAAYFLVASPKGVRASAQYHRQMNESSGWDAPIGPVRMLGHVYRHFYAFGVSLLDRLAMMSTKDSLMKIEREGMENLQEAVKANRGVIVLGAHAGNWQAAGNFLSLYNKPVNLVVLENEVERIRNMTDRAMSGRKYNVIGVDAKFSQSFEILAALRRGEIVALHGDRVMGGRSFRVPFLGREAAFPAGPYSLAAASGAALVQVFTMREPGWQYRFIAHEPQWLTMPPRANREEFLRRNVAQYAARLEATIRRYPYQWYNFYPFWDEPSPSPGLAGSNGK